MKTTLIIIANILRWVVILAILLFSLATFMGCSYLQTIILVLIAIALAYWPKYFKSKWNMKTWLISRIAFIIILFVINFLFLGGEPLSSIYISETHHENLIKIYDEKMNEWPENTEDIYIDTKYGKVHILACGSKDNPPLMMIHAASMGAHSWAENLDAVIDNYRIYSFDNIGEGNKSELNDPTIFPQNGIELADLYASLADSLEIKSSPVLASSNGGFVALNYTYYYPERVEKLALFGPMGLTQLSNKSFIMLSLSTIYPFQAVRDYVTKWAIGDDYYVIKKYGDWFNCIMAGTIPSFTAPVPMSTAQKKEMDLPIMLFLGTKDQIVGDAEIAKKAGEEYPNIQIEILESGHLVSVERAKYINPKIREFLKN